MFMTVYNILYRFQALSENFEERLLVLSCLSAWKDLASTGRIFIKFYVWIIFENLSRNQTFHWIRTKGTLQKEQYTCLIISRSILLRMRNVSDKICRENFQRLFFFFRKSCRLWDNAEKILYSRLGYRWPHSTCALHAGYLRLKIHSRNI